MYLAPPIIEKFAIGPRQPRPLLPVGDALREVVNEVLSEVVNDVLRDHIPSGTTRQPIMSDPIIGRARSGGGVPAGPTRTHTPRQERDRTVGQQIAHRHLRAGDDQLQIPHAAHVEGWTFKRSSVTRTARS